MSCVEMGVLRLALGSLFMAIRAVRREPVECPAAPGAGGTGRHRLARDDFAEPGSIRRPRRRRSRRSACSTRSTMRSCAPIPARRWARASPKSWQESEDGLTYEFKLRPGLKFHNGDPLTTEDVKFSFERYQGAGAQTLKDHVREVEIVDPLVVRFHLKEPWPDFMTFYGTTATAAGIVVPKKYLTEVGDDGFKKHPIGAGPYKFVSNKPGIEVELEAFPGYWRRVPNVKTLGHAQRPRRDDAGADAQDRRGRHGLRARRRRRRRASEATRACKSSRPSTPRSSGSSSPSSGTRNRRGTTSGCGWRSTTRSTASGSTRRPASASARRPGVIVPRVMDFALQVEPLPYDLPKAKQLLAEAGYPNGIDAGDVRRQSRASRPSRTRW